MEFVALLATILCLSVPPLVRSDECVQCTGENCFTPEHCHNADSCFIAKYRLGMGKYKYGKDRLIKGCMSGSMLKDDIQDHCEARDDQEVSEVNCFCKNKKSKVPCNRHSVGKKAEKIKKVSCVECDGEKCDDMQRCKGDACHYTRVYDKKGNVESYHRGCIADADIPMIGRSARMSCSRPPLAMSTIPQLVSTKIANTEACLCSHDFCNLQPDLTMRKKSKKCPILVAATFPQIVIVGIDLLHEDSTCNGEYCYDVNRNDTHQGTDMQHLRFKGCMTYLQKKEKHVAELRDRGCLKLQSENFAVEMCFETDKPETEEEAGEEEKEQEEVMQKDAVKKVEAKEEQVKVKEVGKYEHDVVYNPGASDGANTTLVAVFIVIIIVIVIAFVVWKFDLHSFQNKETKNKRDQCWMMVGRLCAGLRRTSGIVRQKTPDSTFLAATALSGIMPDKPKNAGQKAGHAGQSYRIVA